MRILKSLFLLSLSVVGCKSNSRTVHAGLEKQPEAVPQSAATRPVLIYKTKANYDSLVPVMLSEDKSQIISYPHPSDVGRGGEFPVPTHLSGEYLLDNRGVGKNVAFLKLSYEEYANLKAVPSLKELFELIVDKDPLVELWKCGENYPSEDPVNRLNEIIRGGKLMASCEKF